MTTWPNTLEFITLSSTMDVTHMTTWPNALDSITLSSILDAELTLNT